MEWEQWMREALALAEAAERNGDIPVGAVVIRDGTIIGRGYNRREADSDPTAHAEILAIRDACRSVGNWRLNGCSLVVTLEPCVMCTGAVIQSRISTVIYGAEDPEAGCCGSRMVLSDEELGSHPAVYGGVLKEECTQLLTGFFQRRRQADR